MKITFIVVFALILIAFAGFFFLGFISRSGVPNGLVGDKLARCPGNLNCICTEFEDDISHYISPIGFSQIIAPEALTRIKNSIREAGGVIQTENGNYLAVTFTSSFFKFIDDLEIRIDMDQKMIHMRSASRVGYSDRGINKRRVEYLKKLFHIKAE